MIHDLRISHSELADHLERSDIMRIHTLVNPTLTLGASSGNEDPQISVFIHLNRRIVMRIDYAVHTLIHHDSRLLKHTGCVVIASDHTLKILLILRRCSSINKICTVCFLRINRHRNMLHGIGSKTSAVFRAIIRSLTKVKPDASVTGNRLTDLGLIRLNIAFRILTIGSIEPVTGLRHRHIHRPAPYISRNIGKSTFLDFCRSVIFKEQSLLEAIQVCIDKLFTYKTAIDEIGKFSIEECTGETISLHIPKAEPFFICLAQDHDKFRF